VADEFERGGQFVEEKVGRRTSIPPPPFVDGADLFIGLRRRADLQDHRC
jgi:hypothetical protein